MKSGSEGNDAKNLLEKDVERRRRRYRWETKFAKEDQIMSKQTC
jgi:hypothetical protein